MSQSNPDLDAVNGAASSMSSTNPGSEADGSSTPSTAQDGEADGSSTPSTRKTKRVNWEIGDDAIVKVLIHAAVLREKPGSIITELIKNHLNDFSITDQRKTRVTRARNQAAKGKPKAAA